MFANEVKYQRALKTLKEQGFKTPTEEQVKELYLKYGGLWIEKPVVEEVEEEVKKVSKEVSKKK